MTKQYRIQKIQNLISNLIDELTPLAEYGPNHCREALRWLHVNHDLEATPFSTYEIVQGFAILRCLRHRATNYSRMEKTHQRLRKYLLA